jgi:hypothetical protein
MFEINFGAILQVVVAALLVGVGRIVYQTSVNVATLSQRLDDHTKQDADNFADLKRRIGTRTKKK